MNQNNSSKSVEPGEIMALTRHFLKTEFQPVLRLILKYVLPFLLLLAYLQVTLQIKITTAATLAGDLSPDRLVTELSGMYGNLLLILFFHQFVLALLGATLYSYFLAVHRGDKKTTNPSEPAQLLFPLSVAAIPVLLMATIISLFGLMLFVVPGIVVANYLSLSLFTAVYEQKGTLHALGRSLVMVRNNWWKLLLLNLTGIAIIYLVNIVVGLPSLIYQKASGTLGTTQIMPAWHWWMAGLGIVISSIAYIVPMLFHAFVYLALNKSEE